MRPLKLTISAFGTFAKEEIINFDKIGENGIYLICGDTGAGKTTIFDAISFALYGELSGDNRESKMMRSDFASLNTDTYVELEFLCKDKEYRVRRSPEYMRPKKKGEGLIKSASKADFECISENIVLSSNTKETNSKIIEILGISRKQFSQIVMIAQGDFLKLLLSDTKDKQEILRRIFETENYEKFQEKLSEKKAEIYNERKDIIKYLADLINDIKIDEDLLELNESKEIQSASLYNEDLIKNIGKIILLQKEKEKNEKKINDDLNEKKNKLQTDIVRAERINNDFLEYDKLIKRHSDLLEEKDKYDAYKIKYANAEKAIDKIKPFEDNYKKSKFSLETLIVDIEKLEKEKNLAIVELEELKEDLEQVDSKKKEIENLNILIDQFEKNKDKYQELEDKQKLILSINKSLEIKKEELNILEESKTKKENQIKEISITLDKNKNIDSEISTNTINTEKLNAKFDKATEALKIYKTIVSNNKKYDESITLYNESNDKYILRNSEYEKYAERFFRERAGILAKDLKEGCPCPVCGSKEHPEIAKLTNDDLSEETLKELEIEKNNLNTEREEKSKDCASIKISNDKDKEIFIEMSKELLNLDEANEDIEKQNYTISNMLTQLKDEILELTDKNKELKDKKIELEKLEIKFKEISNILNKIPSEINTIKEDMHELKLKITAEESTIESIKKILKFDSLLDAEKDYNNNLASKKNIDNFIKDIRETNKKLEKEVDRCKTTLIEKEKSKVGLEEEVKFTNTEYTNRLKEYFKNEEDYINSILDKDTIEHHKKEVEKYNKNLENIKGGIATYEEKLKDEQKEELSDKKDELNNIQTSINNSNDKFIDISSNIRNNEEKKKSIEDYINKNKENEKKYAIISSLSDTANGTISEKSKITFETYVQMSYFGEIISAANLRFDTMTDGRYYLVHNKNVGVKNKKIGLEINVMDNHTGRERDIKTLSGGESFKASLALALGLSDVVQRRSGGIKIDSMFIDEGFGSLDSDSLESAIEVLTGLSSNNCIVGIISHVSELKDRIDKKIKVKKSSSGSSIEEEF